ncbi:MAG: MBL fold metallo-hydrolase [Dehalococcoidia bacterium]
MEIVPGINQLKLPLKDNPLEYVNTYMVQGDDGWLLIDTGWNDQESLDAFTRQLNDIGVGFEEIRLIIPTHIHPDHFGLAGRLRQLCQAELALSETDRGFIESAGSWAPTIMRDMSEWLFINGVPRDYLTEYYDISSEALDLIIPAAPDRGLQDGEIISTGMFDLQVIWTPGHAPGHICLYEPSNRILFSGDHILPVTTPNISIHMELIGDPLRDYLQSLRKIRNLDMALGLPAHEHTFTDLRGRVDELLAHHELRKTEILESIASKPKTAFQISSQITWMEGTTTWEELGVTDKRIAVTEALAHLESLRDENRVTKSREEDLYYYQPC